MSSPAFEQLLAALGPDREQAGAEYRELHTRLVKFFEWECGAQPDAQADEVLDRVTRRIAQGERIENLRAYVYGVAKLLLREIWKRVAREEEARSQLLRLVPPFSQDSEPSEAECQQDCLETCLSALTDRNRDIILTYYSDEQQGRIDVRRQLAARLGTDLNALRVRAHRIRAGLEQCVGECVGSTSPSPSGTLGAGRR